jgi:protein-disulfide isomerase
MRTPILIAVLASALSLSACQKTDDAAFGARVRAYLLEHPEVIEEAVTKLRQGQMLEAAKAQAPAIGRLRQQLERDPRDLVINPGGTVTIVEFFDYRCGYCKRIAPDVLQLIAENPDVRMVFKEFPIFGEVSDSAARMALTTAGKGKGLALHKAWMNERALDEAALDRHLTEVGLSPGAVRAAAAQPAITRQLADVRALARELGLEGTPAFIVGDYLIPGADMAALRAALAKVRAGVRPPANPT